MSHILSESVQDYPGSTVKMPSYMEKQSSENEVIGDYKNRFSNVNEQKLMMRIDMRVIPPICLLYLLAFLDRVNVGNAAVFGLAPDLKLKGLEFNTCLAIFFVAYALFEIPSNMLMKRFRPHIWLSCSMFLFGMVTCLQGTVNGYSGLFATRFFLGLCETSILPGSIYLISMWYRREEALKRYMFFYASVNMAGAFGGLLASAIGNMNGVGSYKAWRWVFILEGLATCVVSIILFFWISDFPEEVTWLSTEEKAFVKQRLYDDLGDSNHGMKVDFTTVGEVLKDFKVLISGFMYMGMVISGYCYAFFSPSIIQGLGHSPIQTQLYSVPPYAFSCVLSIVIAVFSDMTKRRFIFYLFAWVMGLAGFIILLVVHHRMALQYAALFLAIGGVNSALPIVICWTNTNLGGHRRRNVATAYQTGVGAMGSIISTYSFLAKEAPRYISGYSICVGFMTLSGLSSLAYYISLIVDNRKRDRGLANGADLPSEERLVMGDLNPDYRYML